MIESTEKGCEQIDTFVKKRLDPSEESFWDPIPNLKVKTISTTTKKTDIKTVSDKFITVSADRDLFGRLLIVSNVRKVNFKEVLICPFAEEVHLHLHIRTVAFGRRLRVFWLSS